MYSTVCIAYTGYHNWFGMIDLKTGGRGEGGARGLHRGCNSYNTCSDEHGESSPWKKKGKSYTLCKTDLILRSIEGVPNIQFSMANKFPLQPKRRYNVKRNEKTEQT
jgi:hypothetical protein